MRKNIPDSLIKKSFSYNPETGVVCWRRSPARCIKPGQRAGRVTEFGYRYITIQGKSLPEHHIVWFLHYGKWPKDQIDHINHDRADNSIKNLREADQLRNSKNMKMNKNNKTGIMGVHFDQTKQKYIARIGGGPGKWIENLGRSEDFFEACCLRKAAENKYGYHKNHGKK